jgi:predicted nucleic acid-binding protein
MPDGKVIIDTNVYITAIRQGRDGPAGVRLAQWLPRTYLASVVTAELRAGVRSARGLSAVLGLTDRLGRAGRVVTPTLASWVRAGDTLARIARTRPHLEAVIRHLWNDVLIALSACQVGATVVTDNVDDFSLLRAHLDFDFESFSGTTV